MSQSRRLTLLTLLIAVLALSLLAELPGQHALAQDPVGAAPGDAAPGRGTLEERTMQEAIQMLGWPDTIERQRLFYLEPDDETMYILWPPSSALRYLYRTKVSANNGGSYDDETIQYARILSLGEEGGQFYIDKMIENGLPASSYQGRPGIVMRVDDELCNPGGLLGYLTEMIREIFRDFFEALGQGDAWDETCPTAAVGLITWSCGSHTFVVRDDTGSGAEDQIAAALYLAAQNQGLCDMGDTLVILAGTDDVAGARALSHFQQLAQDNNSYYGQNAYGRVGLSYTFMDADGNASAGAGDWFNIGGNMATYANREKDFVVAAVEKAFEHGAPREEINLARVIVVYAGPSNQATHDAASPAPLSTLCVWPDNARWHEIEVGPPSNRATVYAGSLVMVAEEDGLGLWAHEVGHTLFSRHMLWAKWNRVSDRYNYQQPWGKYGDINNWGLMGAGNWWGDPMASNPVHMSAFSKEAAGWLSYQAAELGKQYTLKALESGSGATALQIDDPNVANPEWYYLLEARQAGGWYGAPESGVVLYMVTWDSAHNHHTINTLPPQEGDHYATGLGGRSYERAAFQTASNRTVYRIPSRKLEFRIHSESTADGYSAVVSVSVYTPTAIVGAAVAPAAVPPPAAPPTVTANLDGPLPDIDLHAYDDQGRHVGLNYETGEYELQIPGAVASGDLRGAEEWIYVPEGTAVRYEVSAYKTEQFLAANPAFRADAKPQEFEIEYGRFDHEGTYTVASARKQEVASGQTTAIPSPDDPSLKYKAASVPGYGRNWPSQPYWTGFIGAILLLGLGGWIAGLARRK
jgi:M6 family metalloprotease-like protein